MLTGVGLASLSANAIMLIAIITLFRLLWNMRHGAATAAKATAAAVTAVAQTVRTTSAGPECVHVGPCKPDCPNYGKPENTFNPGSVLYTGGTITAETVYPPADAPVMATPKQDWEGVHTCATCGLVFVLSSGSHRD